MRRWMGGAFGVAALAAAVAGFSSCRQIAGIQDNPPATSACGLAYGTSACAACASTNCCAQSSACAADLNFCSPYESCLGACNGDEACRSQCTIDHHVPADNSAPVSALSACLASKCETECGLTCGGFAGYFSMPDAAPSCATCLVKNACSDERRCGSSVECDAFWRCYLACQTPDCQFACMPAHDAGAELFKPLYRDFSGTCLSECGYGSYWACAGHVTPPNAKSADVKETIRVHDFLSGAGIADAAVSVCGFASGPGCPCPTDTNRVVAQGTTDANGNVTLSFQQDLSATGSGSSYCLQVKAPGYLDTFTIVASPDTEPVVSVDDSLLPNTWGPALETPAAQQALDRRVTGVTLDPTLTAVVGARLFDCLSSPASGVDVSFSTSGPSTTLTDSVADAGPNAGFNDAGPTVVRTNVQGVVVIVNVPPDAGLTITASVPGIGKVSQTSVNTAPGTLIEVAMPPTP